MFKDIWRCDLKVRSRIRGISIVNFSTATIDRDNYILYSSKDLMDFKCRPLLNRVSNERHSAVAQLIEQGRMLSSRPPEFTVRVSCRLPPPGERKSGHCEFEGPCCDHIDYQECDTRQYTNRVACQINAMIKTGVVRAWFMHRAIFSSVASSVID